MADEEQLNNVPKEGTGAENEDTKEEVVVDFDDFTATKMKELSAKADTYTDEENINILTARVLNRIKAQAIKGKYSLSVLYASASMDFKPKLRGAVINNLFVLGYVVREVMEDNTAIGFTVTWDE